jgi:hypothetical protein
MLPDFSPTIFWAKAPSSMTSQNRWLKPTAINKEIGYANQIILNL